MENHNEQELVNTIKELFKQLDDAIFHAEKLGIKVEITEREYTDFPRADKVIRSMSITKTINY